MAERKERKNFMVHFSEKGKPAIRDYLSSTKESDLPPLIRPITSARETGIQFLDGKYQFGEKEKYPPYVLAYSPSQLGFYLINTKSGALNQVIDDDICETVGDNFWPPLSDSEKNEDLTCSSLRNTPMSRDEVRRWDIEQSRLSRARNMSTLERQRYYDIINALSKIQGEL